MALTTCTECHAQISDQAAACPKCGAPRRGVVTTQATAKRYKGAQLLAALVVSVGVVGVIGGGHLWGSLTAFAGLGLYFVARARSWWAHG